MCTVYFVKCRKYSPLKIGWHFSWVDGKVCLLFIAMSNDNKNHAATTSFMFQTTESTEHIYYQKHRWLRWNFTIMMLMASKMQTNGKRERKSRETFYARTLPDTCTAPKIDQEKIRRLVQKMLIKLIGHRFLEITWVLTVFKQSWCNF